MTPNDAHSYLLSLQSRGIKLDLSRMRRSLVELGHPERQFPIVLVAGTNGKGSTASALASILKASGQRVGLFTSPHLVDYRERIRIDGRMITPEHLADEVEASKAVWEQNDLTFFECAVALALTSFRTSGVDLAVLEIGLGGRLDATNTTEPCLSVVTAIGYDHMHILGDTLPRIAAEKAGIFRRGVPVAIQGGYAQARMKLEERARRFACPLYVRSQSLYVRDIHPVAGELRTGFHVAARDETAAGLGIPTGGLDFEIPMWGRHQVSNAALAAMAARIPGGIPTRPSWSDVAEGLSRWTWPGRFLRPDPEKALLFDAGHNRQAGRQLSRALLDYAGDRPVELVVGMVAKKDHYGYLRSLRRVSSKIRLVLPDTPRAAERSELEEAARRADFQDIEWSESVGEGLQRALEVARDPDGPLAVLAGSLFVLDEGYRHLGLTPPEQLWAELPAPVG